MWETILLATLFCTAHPNPEPAVAERTEESQIGSLLAAWEAQSNRGDVIQIEFTRFSYDDVWDQERRSTGRLIFGDGRYRIDVHPIEYLPEDKSQRENYKLRPDRAETWVSNSSRTMQIDHTNRQIDVFPHVKRDPNVAIAKKRSHYDNAWLTSFFPFSIFTDLCLPTFLRVKAADLKRRFRIVQVDQTKKDVTTLRIVPPRGRESPVWSAIFVMWDHKKGRVHALKIIDPSGNLETVYVVTSYKVDPKLDLDSIFNPEFPGYSIHEYRAR